METERRYWKKELLQRAKEQQLSKQVVSLRLSRYIFAYSFPMLHVAIPVAQLENSLSYLLSFPTDNNTGHFLICFL